MEDYPCLFLKQQQKKVSFRMQTAKEICKIAELPTWDANSYVARQISQGNPLVESIRDCNDAESCRYIIDALIDRAAKLVAASMSAVILKCGKGKSPEKPVLITVEGTTFYKLHNFRSTV